MKLLKIDWWWALIHDTTEVSIVKSAHILSRRLVAIYLILILYLLNLVLKMLHLNWLISRVLVLLIWLELLQFLPLLYW